jgi:hypothetical protein
MPFHGMAISDWRIPFATASKIKKSVMLLSILEHHITHKYPFGYLIGQETINTLKYVVSLPIFYFCFALCFTGLGVEYK